MTSRRGSNHHSWTGGKIKVDGYWLIWQLEILSKSEHVKKHSIPRSHEQFKINRLKSIDL